MNTDTNKPLLIGGVGGSGTRIVTEIVKQMGYFMGSKLNESNDNMILAPLFPSFREMTHRHCLSHDDNYESNVSAWIDKLHEAVLQDVYSHQQQSKSWGWKIPANFFLIKYLKTVFPEFKYIHVIRNGLDMAYSKNQQQLKRWGFFFGIDHEKLPEPQASLQYWIKANSYAIASGNNNLGNDFLLLNFDRLCESTSGEINKVMKFLGKSSPEAGSLENLVVSPASMGRYLEQDLSTFSKEDVQQVRALGFSV